MEAIYFEMIATTTIKYNGAKADPKTALRLHLRDTAMAKSGVVHVIGGSVPKHEFTFYYKLGTVTFVAPSAGDPNRRHPGQPRIAEVFESLEQVTEVNAPDLVRTGLLSGIGALMLGPVGLLAGAVALTNGKAKKVTFTAKLKSVGQIVAQTDGETFSQMLAQHCTQTLQLKSCEASAKPEFGATGGVRAMMPNAHSYSKES